MVTPQQLTSLIDIVKKIEDTSFNKRHALYSANLIPKIEWELNNENEMYNYVKAVTTKAGLGVVERSEVEQDVKDLLAKNSFARPTVRQLESELRDLRAQLNNALAASIITSISGYKIKIIDANDDLTVALQKLNNLNESFGAIAIAVNLVAAMVSVATGKFDLMVKVLSEAAK